MEREYSIISMEECIKALGKMTKYTAVVLRKAPTFMRENGIKV